MILILRTSTNNEPSAVHCTSFFFFFIIFADHLRPFNIHTLSRGEHECIFWRSVACKNLCRLQIGQSRYTALFASSSIELAQTKYELFTVIHNFLFHFTLPVVVIHISAILSLCWPWCCSTTTCSLCVWHIYSSLLCIYLLNLTNNNMILIWLFSFDVFFSNILLVVCAILLWLLLLFVIVPSRFRYSFYFSHFFPLSGCASLFRWLWLFFFGFTILRNCANKEQNCCIRLVSVAKMFPDKNAKSTNERRKWCVPTTLGRIP